MVDKESEILFNTAALKYEIWKLILTSQIQIMFKPVHFHSISH